VGGNGQTSTVHGIIRRPWASVDSSERKAMAQTQQGEGAAIIGVLSPTES